MHRAGAKHGNVDGFSRQLPGEQLPDWHDGEMEQLVQPNLEPCTATEAIESLHQCLVRSVSFDPARTDEAHACQNEILLEAQKNDPVTGVFRKRTNAEEQATRTSLSKRDVKMDEASEHGSEMLSPWSTKNRLENRYGFLYYRLYSAGSMPMRYLPVLPYKLRGDMLGQGHGIQASGGHMAVDKTFDRTRQCVCGGRVCEVR